MQFSIVSNTNPGLVTPTIGTDQMLDLVFTAGQTGTAEITIQATDGNLVASDTNGKGDAWDSRAFGLINAYDDHEPIAPAVLGLRAAAHRPDQVRLRATIHHPGARAGARPGPRRP